MATNKNQHFVPRCYLRPFTLGSDNAAISVFNLDRKKLIPNAPVKNQCSKDYFYGTDELLEKAIQSIESGYSQALREFIQDTRSLPEKLRMIFRRFWLFQHLRTEAAAMQSVKMAESIIALADIPPEEFSLGIKEAVQIACKQFASTMHVIDDLKFCVIKNKSNVPFITSDNPAVLTNKWQLNKDRLRGLSFGLGSAGVLTFLPLTPKLLFLGYDGDVYSVPNERGIVEVKSTRDIIALNQHQFLHCVANVYAHDITLEKMLVGHFLEIEQARPVKRHVVHYAEFDRAVGDYARYAVVPPEKRDVEKEAMMHSQIIHPRPAMWPSQIKFRRNGSVYANGTGMGYVRLSQTHLESHREFWKERP